ncbi:SFH1 [Symbiodinium natans]|uniref:SFH1 protein n=1 Tax=Symbiodinium natans TaxID=878477 RepID=A0A812SWI4_9DINO|nr:SFH1 [Symbiodinium natans]
MASKLHADEEEAGFGSFYWGDEFVYPVGGESNARKLAGAVKGKLDESGMLRIELIGAPSLRIALTSLTQVAGMNEQEGVAGQQKAYTSVCTPHVLARNVSQVTIEDREAALHAQFSGNSFLKKAAFQRVRAVDLLVLCGAPMRPVTACATCAGEAAAPADAAAHRGWEEELKLSFVAFVRFLQQAHQLTCFLVSTAEDVGTGEGRHVVVLALGLLAVALAVRRRPRQVKPKVKPRRQPTQLPTGMKLCGSSMPRLCFEGEDMARFEREVIRIYAVDHSKPPLGDGKSRPSSFVPSRNVADSLRHMRTACKDLEAETAEDGRIFEPLDDVLMARHLIAADFDLGKCTEVVRNYVSLRQQLCGGVPPDLSWLSLGFAIAPFEDVMGRPVFLARARYIPPDTCAEAFRTLYRGLADAVIMHLLQKRSTQMSELNPLEQYVLVIDVAGATRSNFSMAAVKVMISESNANYPDRVAEMFVLGANMVVRSLWSLVSPMVHPRTRHKVHMVGPAEVPETMRRLVGSSELVPEEYGGTGRRLPAPTESRNVVDMAGRLAAGAWDRAGALKSFEERTARSRVGVAWNVPRNSFQAAQASSFRLWLANRGEGTAVIRSQAEVIDFLADLLLRGLADLGETPVPGGCCPTGHWLIQCLTLRHWEPEAERAKNAARAPEVLARCFGRILSEHSGREPARAVLDFVTGSGPYVLRR